MWGIGRSKHPETFAQKADRFWEQFSERSSTILEGIDQGWCEDFTEETSELVSAVFPGFAWNYGPPPEGVSGHSLTISGDGIRHRQFLSECLVKRAPRLDGWTFYSSRQATRLVPGGSIHLEGVAVELAGIWIATSVDQERQIVDLVVWHPAFSDLSESATRTVVYLALDEVLGEFGTDQWIGKFTIDDSKLAEAMPVGELSEFLSAVREREGWEKSGPTVTYELLTFRERQGDFFRGDMRTLTTLNFPLIREYLNASGQIPDDPVAGSGADLIFIFYPSDLVDPSGSVEFRGRIEDRLEERFNASNDGRVIGGSLGYEYSYVDLLVLDGDRSLNEIARILRQDVRLPGGGIEFFAAGNEGRRIMF